MRKLKRIFLFTVVLLAASAGVARASSASAGHAEERDPGAVISEHLADNYWWHITTIKDHHISLYLPVIVRSKESGWAALSSKKISHWET